MSATGKARKVCETFVIDCDEDEIAAIVQVGSSEAHAAVMRDLLKEIYERADRRTARDHGA